MIPLKPRTIIPLILSVSATMLLALPSQSLSAPQDPTTNTAASHWAIDAGNESTCYTDSLQPVVFPKEGNDSTLISDYNKDPGQFTVRWITHAFLHKRELPIADIARIENRGTGMNAVMDHPMQLMFVQTVSGEGITAKVGDLGVLWACKGPETALHCIYSIDVRAQCRIPERAVTEWRTIEFHSIQLARQLSDQEWEGMLDLYAQNDRRNHKSAIDQAAFARADADAKVRANEQFKNSVASVGRGALLFCSAAYLGDQRGLAFDRMNLDCHLNGGSGDQSLSGGWLLEHGWTIVSDTRDKVARGGSVATIYEEVSNVILKKTE